MSKPRTPEITHKIMSAVHNKNTRPELAVRKELFKRGWRYRVNYNKLSGKPDIVFTKLKVCIFVDGDFWHGRNWVTRGYGSFEEELKRYSDYWQKKLLRNIERDKEVNKTLEESGWTVIRVWETDVKKDFEGVIDRIEKELRTRITIY